MTDDALFRTSSSAVANPIVADAKTDPAQLARFAIEHWHPLVRVDALLNPSFPPSRLVAAMEANRVSVSHLAERLSPEKLAVLAFDGPPHHADRVASEIEVKGVRASDLARASEALARSRGVSLPTPLGRAVKGHLEGLSAGERLEFEISVEERTAELAAAWGGGEAVRKPLPPPRLVEASPGPGVSPGLLEGSQMSLFEEGFIPGVSLSRARSGPER